MPRGCPNVAPRIFTSSSGIPPFTKKGANEMRSAFAKTILVVDEGSLASTVQARDLSSIATEIHIPRVVLIGDRIPPNPLSPRDLRQTSRWAGRVSGFAVSSGDSGYRNSLSLLVGAPYGSTTRFKLECIVGAHCRVRKNLKPRNSEPLERQAHPCHAYSR